MTADLENALAKALERNLRRALGNRSIVLVGMMGSGKSSVGRRLALALDLPFSDADAEIEVAAGMTIEEIFQIHGEPYFRKGEERVIRRLLQGGPQVLATGGGAVISLQTRERIAESCVSIWLNAPLDLLVQRVLRRDNRPLLKAGDHRAVLSRLLAERIPFYSAADLIFESRDAPHDAIVDEMLSLVSSHLEKSKQEGIAATSLAQKEQA